MKELSTYITADTTVDYLSNYINKLSESKIICDIAPYNQVSQVLLSDAKADNLIIWSCPDLQIPTYAKILLFEEVKIEKIMEEVLQFANKIKIAAKKYKSIFMLSWSFPPEQKWPLALSSKPNFGAMDILLRMNIYLSDLLKDSINFFMIDTIFLQSNFESNIHDPRMFAMGRIKYSLDYQEYVAKELVPIVFSTIESNKKLIICDLDNTLWSGILGDDGIDGIKIGGNDPLGEVHLQIQKIIKGYKNRGIVLAIASKNYEETALHAIANLPNMLLSKNDFATYRINWLDKAKNISEILEELNLLSSSTVFLDDSITERKRVKESFPDMLVPELPSDVSKWPKILNEISCFDSLTYSKEDKERTKIYLDESKRIREKEKFISLQSWLNSLELIVKIQSLNKENISRSSQLLNKTNQFNLKTRRMSKEDLSNLANKENVKILTFSIEDKYGKSGLTGLVSAEYKIDNWEISDFVMSCRVMGKKIEYAMLSEIRNTLNTDKPIKMEYIPTKKNKPIREFVEEIAPEGFILDTLKKPEHVSIEILD